MISFKQLKQLCSDYPNDMKLGEHIRSMYTSTRDITQPTQGMYIPSAVDDAAEVMRESAAQQSITEGTSVTSLDSAMEKAHRLLEDENRFAPNTSKDYTINPEVQLEIDFK